VVLGSEKPFLGLRGFGWGMGGLCGGWGAGFIFIGDGVLDRWVLSYGEGCGGVGNDAGRW